MPRRSTITTPRLSTTDWDVNAARAGSVVAPAGHSASRRITIVAAIAAGSPEDGASQLMIFSR